MRGEAKMESRREGGESWMEGRTSVRKTISERSGKVRSEGDMHKSERRGECVLRGRLSVSSDGREVGTAGLRFPAAES